MMIGIVQRKVRKMDVDLRFLGLGMILGAMPMVAINTRFAIGLCVLGIMVAITGIVVSIQSKAK